MMVISLLDDILVASWLWGVTIDVNHLFMCCFVMFCLLYFVMRSSFWVSLLLAMSVCCASFFLFSGIVFVLLSYALPGEYAPVTDLSMLPPTDVFKACAQLAVIYTLFQCCLFMILNFFRSIYSWGSYVLICALSNGIALAISYVGVRMMMYR